MCASAAARAQARVPHHLLAVVRPAFGVGVTDVQLPDPRSRPVGVQELQEVPRPHLVRRRKEQLRLAGHVFRLVFPGPLRIGRRDVIDGRQVLLVGPRRDDVREILRVVRRRQCHERFLRARNRHEVMRDDERLQFGQLPSRPLDGASLRLAVVHLVDAGTQGLSRRVLGAGLAQGLEVAVHVRAPDGLQSGRAAPSPVPLPRACARRASGPSRSPAWPWRVAPRASPPAAAWTSMRPSSPPQARPAASDRSPTRRQLGRPWRRTRHSRRTPSRHSR